MTIMDMMAEFSNGIMKGQFEKLKENPEKYDNMLQMSLIGLEMGKIFLQESEEFRNSFARLHAEFLKYPESRKVIEESLVAYSNFEQSRH
jgi:hypothetical protein